MVGVGMWAGPAQMTPLAHSTPVRCRKEAAAGLLSHYFRKHGTKYGNAVQFDLPIGTVFGTFVPAYRPLELPSFAVSLTTAGRNPSPFFGGRLDVDAQWGEDSFRLRLSGHYAPPFQVRESLFDKMFGHWIARRCLTIALADIAAFAESQYRKPRELEAEAPST